MAAERALRADERGGLLDYHVAIEELEHLRRADALGHREELAVEASDDLDVVRLRHRLAGHTSERRRRTRAPARATSGARRARRRAARPVMRVRGRATGS